MQTCLPVFLCGFCQSSAWCTLLSIHCDLSQNKTRKLVKSKMTTEIRLDACQVSYTASTPSWPKGSTVVISGIHIQVIQHNDFCQHSPDPRQTHFSQTASTISLILHEKSLLQLYHHKSMLKDAIFFYYGHVYIVSFHTCLLSVQMVNYRLFTKQKLFLMTSHLLLTFCTNMFAENRLLLLPALLYIQWVERELASGVFSPKCRCGEQENNKNIFGAWKDHKALLCYYVVYGGKSVHQSSWSLCFAKSHLMGFCGWKLNHRERFEPLYL